MVPSCGILVPMNYDEVRGGALVNQSNALIPRNYVEMRVELHSDQSKLFPPFCGICTQFLERRECNCSEQDFTRFNTTWSGPHPLTWNILTNNHSHTHSQIYLQFRIFNQPKICMILIIFLVLNTSVIVVLKVTNNLPRL